MGVIECVIGYYEGASRNTLKEHFRALVEKGHLIMHGHGRGVWYSLAQF